MCFIQMTMNNFAKSRRHLAGVLLPAIVFVSGAAWAGTVYTILDGGVPRQFEIADDEVAVSRNGAGLAKDVKSSMADAVVVKDFGNRVIVRFPRTDWKKAVGPRVFGGAAFEPVAYEQGQARKDAGRRIITAQVLASGANVADLVRISGAADSKATSVDGYFMLSFPSASDALAGTEKLRKDGLKAEPQLRKQANKRAVPNDPFFAEQWHLQNTGQGNGIPGTDINPLLAWDTYKGAGVTLTIVDDGLELAHSDLVGNVLPQGINGPHHDFNGGDDDPSPGFGDAHGTACAGVAAARGDNGLGVSGGGPQANLLGLRLISGPFTDADENAAFTWSGGGVPTVIDISSNSWGPFDDVRLEGPGILALDGLRTSVTTGRGGNGVVFCWAGGNGRGNDDNVNMDGYANSRYVVSVGAVGNDAKQSFYSESGSPLLVCAPSNGGPLGIFTTDVSDIGGYNDGFTFGEPNNLDYTNSFGGTSSAAPLVAGVVSLILEANSTLGYRDVMEILAGTASKVDPTNVGWVTNGGGFQFNHGFGSGMVDATAAVTRAGDWVNLGPETVQERILSAPAVPIVVPDANDVGITRNFNFSNGPSLRVEHVEVQLDIAHGHRSDLQITLTSPSGHVSRIIERRARPTNGNSDVDYTDGNIGWIFTSSQHWGEDSVGTWSVNISDKTAGTVGTLQKARIRLYGTPAPDTRFTFERRLETVSEFSPQIVIPVRRLGSADAAGSVDFYISPRGTATAGVDFTGVTGTLNFGVNETVKNITVPIRDDTLTEGDERFLVVLTNPTGGTLGGASLVTVEIDDNEGNAVTVAASDPTASERNLATQVADNGVFTISRKIAPNTPLEVKYTLTQPPLNPDRSTPNYAVHIQDYVELPFKAIIPAGQLSVDVVVAPRNDRLSEGTELVELIITPDSAYNLGLPNSAIVSILDNDLVPVSVTTSVASVLESSNTEIVYTITRDTNQLDAPLNIFMEPSGTAEAQIDYDPPFPAVVTIPPGSATATVSIHPNDNSVFNPVKTIILRVSQGPEYKEGFFKTVEVRIFDDEPVPDAVKPTVAISSPVKNTRIDHPAVLTATGTAKDNPDADGKTNAAQVRFRLNRGPWNAAALTNEDWTADITDHSALGDNLLEVYSIDEAGNESAISHVEFTYVKKHNLTMTVVGPGSVPDAFTGTKELEVGQPYTIVAKPSSSANLFNGWSGAFTATNKSLSFVMPDEDIALTAAFSPALIPDGLTGKFAGLVSRNQRKRVVEVDLATSGYFEASISKTGKFSGKLIYGGVTYSVRGDMTADGNYIGEIPRKQNTPLVLSLSLRSGMVARAVRGGVPVRSGTYLVGTVSADGTDSYLDCPKALTKEEAPSVTTDVAGKFTFQMPMSDTVTQSKPQGTGVGTLTVDARGNVRWSGVLPDGTPATQSAYLSVDKTWPLFLNLYGGRGVMLGVMFHDKNQATTDFAGHYDWRKIGEPRDKLFPNGFAISGSELLGSAYTPPESGQRVLTSFTSGNGSLTMEAGNFRVPFPVKSVGITDQNKITIAPEGPDKLALRVATSNGALSGTFLHPVTAKKVKISGVVLQKTQRGAGVFIGMTPSKTALQTGRMGFGQVNN